MRSFLVFLVLLALVVCQVNEVNGEERKKEMRQKMKDCILKSELLTDDLRKEIEKNKDDDLRTVLALSILKSDSNIRLIIKNCRKHLFGNLRNKKVDEVNQKFKSKLSQIAAQ